MMTVDMYSLWGDDTSNIVKGISEATNNIIHYYHSMNTTKEMLCELREDIEAVCDFWAGKTYVGEAKGEKIKDGFQRFFSELMRFLLSMKDSDRTFEKTFAEALLYRGQVYRYLGDSYPSGKIVTPLYDNIYVSWSKNPKNSYIESKLCGTQTWLSCEIAAPLYGIDLEAMGVSKSSEREVVFPTIKQYIKEIKYLYEDEEDDQTR